MLVIKKLYSFKFRLTLIKKSLREEGAKIAPSRETLPKKHHKNPTLKDAKFE